MKKANCRLYSGRSPKMTTPDQADNSATGYQFKRSKKSALQRNDKKMALLSNVIS